MNIYEHLAVTARLVPEHVAIQFEGRSQTYAQLEDLATRAAEQLQHCGVSPGDRVALMLPNVPAFAVWYFGALRLGAIAVSISTRLTDSEVAFVLADSGAAVFVADAPNAEKTLTTLPDSTKATLQVSDDGALCDGEPLPTRSAAPSKWFDAQPDDAAVILYTSGTTGFAKGATLSHLNVCSNAAAFNHLCGMDSRDRILLAVPLFHCFGQNALLNSGFKVGATLVLQRRFDLNESKRLIAEHEVTQLYGVPTMFQLFHDSCTPEDLASVRYCFSAAAKLPEQVSRNWQQKFQQPIYEGYGLTETSPFASYNHRIQYQLGSIGSPIDAVEMKIVSSDTGEACEPGELGEIAIRGPNVMLGYWNRPEDTAAAIRDGWFYSGDIGREDERGLFFVVDRVKDMIVVGGLKVYPAEVERVLLDHGAVAQAAVVGHADQVFGEKVIAFLVLSDSQQALDESLEAELRQICRENLAGYKVPQRFVQLEQLPMNPSGKVLKKDLRSQEVSTSELTADAANQSSLLEPAANELLLSQGAPRTPTLWNDLRQSYAGNRLEIATQFLSELVSFLTGEPVNPLPESRFLELGLDSLMIVALSSQLQAEVGGDAQIPATLVFDYPTVGQLAQYLVATFESALASGDAGPATGPAREDRAAAKVDVAAVPVGLREQVQGMSEDQALSELMRELEDS
ncbi:MAG: AMP-binding protein [Bythopirellula sp.]